MILVLRPERGFFSEETVKRWAIETLFIEEGVINDNLSIEEATEILHRYNVVRVSGANL